MAMTTSSTTYKILFTIIIKMNLMMLKITGNKTIAKARIIMIVKNFLIFLITKKDLLFHQLLFFYF